MLRKLKKSSEEARGEFFLSFECRYVSIQYHTTQRKNRHGFGVIDSTVLNTIIPFVAQKQRKSSLHHTAVSTRLMILINLIAELARSGCESIGAERHTLHTSSARR